MSRPIRVLLVDDQENFAATSAKYLEEHNEDFSVETAPSAAAGLDRLAEDDFDCVVSDHDMPGRDGIEFLETVREDDPDLPFILFTGKGNEEVASEAISAGVSDYLQKETSPSQYTVLAHRVRNAVEQYRSAQEAEETKQLLTEIAERSEDILFVFDGDWEELLFINSAYEEIWGGDLEALQEDPSLFLEYVRPEDRERVTEYIERVAGGETAEIEYQIDHPDGDRRCVRGLSKPIMVEGEVDRIVGFVRDVTAQKRRERELQREREILEQAIDTIDDIFYVVGPDGELRRWNRSITGVTGYTDDELGEMNALEFFPADHQERVSAAIQRAIEEGSAAVEADILTKDGERIRYELSGARLTDPDGTLTGMVGIGRSVADRRQRERELERYETMVNAAGDPQYTLDADGNFTYANEAVAEFTGYDSEELLGEHASKVLPEEAIERAEDVIRELLAAEDEDRATVEMDFLTADGGRIPAETHIALLPHDEEFRGTVGIVRDISTRVEREERLKRERDRLDEFASVISHDLRNPLNAAQLRVDLATKDCESEHLDAAEHSLARMETLIEDLLTLARAGQAVGEPDRVSLEEMAAGCWTAFETGPATLRRETDAAVLADRSRLKQLFENLFRNAIEHAGEDVEITVGDLPTGFYVEDDGPGIAPDEREAVFETGYSTEGPGFGLSIVEQVVQAHGWSISVTAGSDGGARFEITDVRTV